MQNFRVFTITSSGDFKELGNAKSLTEAKRIGRSSIYANIFIENLLYDEMPIKHYKPKENQ